MTGVEHGRPDASSLGDAVRHQVVRELDIPDSGDVLIPHLFRQKGDRRRGGLRLGAAPREGGVVVQVVFLRKIAQREPVSEHDGPVRQSSEEIAEQYAKKVAREKLMEQIEKKGYRYFSDFYRAQAKARLPEASRQAFKASDLPVRKANYGKKLRAVTKADAPNPKALTKKALRLLPNDASEYQITAFGYYYE